jgi:homoserine kinase
LLELGTGLEGHPDNVAAALLGGLAVSVIDGATVLAHSYEIPQITIVVAVPEVDLPTESARAILPSAVPRADAAFNLGRTAFVVEALRSGDLDLLRRTMDDRLHQAFRLARIPGGEAARQAGLEFGAAALSGAGPSIIAFVPGEAAQPALSRMIAAFREAGVASRGFITRPSPRGIHTI